MDFILRLIDVPVTSSAEGYADRSPDSLIIKLR